MKSFHIFWLCLFLGIASLGTLPWIRQFEIRRLEKREAFFKFPVALSGGQTFLRNDEYGEGAFGASRGGGRRRHKGIDLSAPLNSAVTAAKSGRVIFAGEKGGYGYLVELLHLNGVTTRYAHLSELKTTRGEWVRQGAPVGAIGKTGNAKNPKILPHVHFEIRQQNRALNPLSGMMNPSVEVLDIKGGSDA